MKNGHFIDQGNCVFLSNNSIKAVLSFVWSWPDNRLHPLVIWLLVLLLLLSSSSSHPHQQGARHVLPLLLTPQQHWGPALLGPLHRTLEEEEETKPEEKQVEEWKWKPEVKQEGKRQKDSWGNEVNIPLPSPGRHFHHISISHLEDAFSQSGLQGRQQSNQ